MTSAFYSWIRGGLVVLFVYHFIIYIQNKDDINKYYSIYLLCLTIYLIREVFTSETIQYYYQYISFSIQYVAYTSFIYFARSLVDLKEDFPKLDNLLLILAKLLLVFTVVLMMVQFFYGYETQKIVVAYSVPFSTICAFIVFYIISKKKTKQVFYLILGSIIFLLFANISSIKMIKGDYYLIDFKVHLRFYYFIGAIIQSVIFAVLIGNYLRVIIERKREIEINLLTQNNQISELKMTALQSQMNPHFLFNSLNSINNYVLQNKIEEASNFITKFSSLVRKVLQVTSENTITLKEELEILSIYIKLEQMRLKNSFTFTLEVDEEIEQEKLKVVPLFLQPFIENAIWHGLSLNEGEKKLCLCIDLKNDNINVKILDNGIGLHAAKNRNRYKSKNKKSFGINIVKERLKLLYGDNTFISINDISNKDNSGTEVLITFPYII